MVQLNLWMSKRQGYEANSSILSLNSTIRVDENDYIFIEAISDSKDIQAIWLSEIRFPLIISEVAEDVFTYTCDLSVMFDGNDYSLFSAYFKIGEHVTKIFSKIFLNNFGLSEVQIEKKNEYLTVGFIEVTSAKLSDMESLLGYLHDRDVFYWESVSLARSPAKNNNHQSSNLILTLKIVESFLSNLKHNFVPAIQYDYFFRLKHQYEITKNTDATLDDVSLLWLLENASNLESASNSDHDRFFINSKPFVAKTALSSVIKETTDVYENQAIHQFFYELYDFLIATKKRLLHKENQITGDNFKSKLVYSFIGKLKITVDKYLDDFLYYKHELDIAIPVNIISSQLGQQYRLLSKPHYAEIYKHILQWLGKGDVIYSLDSIFSGTKDISKLYELFCLYKVIDVLTESCGFQEIGREGFNQYKTLPDAIFDEVLDIKTNYRFKHSTSNCEVELFYESLPNELTTLINKKKNLRPDYFLKVTNNNKKTYIVLDAKYKKVGNIEEFDYKDLVLKYLHGIGPREGGIFNATALLVFTPILNSGIDFFQKEQHNIYNNKPSYPAIGRIELNPQKGKNVELGEILNHLIFI